MCVCMRVCVWVCITDLFGVYGVLFFWEDLSSITFRNVWWCAQYLSVCPSNCPAVVRNFCLQKFVVVVVSFEFVIYKIFVYTRKGGMNDFWMDGLGFSRRSMDGCSSLPLLACLRVELYVVVGFPLKCITPKRFIIKCVAEQLAEHCIMSINIIYIQFVFCWF